MKARGKQGKSASPQPTRVKCRGEASSEEPEADLDAHAHRDGGSVARGGLKLPGVDRFDRLLIQSEAQRLHHAQIGHIPLGVHHDPQNDRALVFGFAGLLRVTRQRLINTNRLADVAADAERSSAGPATFSRPEPASAAGTYSGAFAFAKAATEPRPVGGPPEDALRGTPGKVS